MVLLCILIVLIGCGDLILALINDTLGSQITQFVRLSRITVVLLLGIYYFLFAHHKATYFLLIFTYIIGIISYSSLSLSNGLDASIVIKSAVSLCLCFVISLSFINKSIINIKSQELLFTLNAFAVANIAFGMYEMATNFWIEIGYDHYLQNVKGIENSLIPDVGLPWNFYHYNLEDRRLAGLLASPLALGPLLAVIASINFVYFVRTRNLTYFVLLIIYLIGLYFTHTRAAMIGFVISSTLFLLNDHSGIRNATNRLTLTAILLICISYALFEIILMSITLADGSTIGHILALKKNIESIHTIILFGNGVGVQGAHAANIGQATYGGGEGAFFTLAYSMGLPFAIILIFILILPVRHAYRNLHLVNSLNLKTLIIATYFSVIGQLPTLIMNEQFFSFSGNFYFYLICAYAYAKFREVRIYNNSKI